MQDSRRCTLRQTGRVAASSRSQMSSDVTTDYTIRSGIASELLSGIDSVLTICRESGFIGQVLVLGESLFFAAQLLQGLLGLPKMVALVRSVDYEAGPDAVANTLIHR